MEPSHKYFSFDFPAFISDWLALAKVRSDGYTIEFVFETVRSRDLLIKNLSARDWLKVEETLRQRIEHLGFGEAGLVAKRSNKKVFILAANRSQKTSPERYRGKVVVSTIAAFEWRPEIAPDSFVNAFSGDRKGCTARQTGNLLILDCDSDDIALELLMSKQKWLPWLYHCCFERPGMPKIQFAQLAVRSVPASVVWRVSDYS